MTIKVEVDLSDFYSETDGEQSFSQEIKNHISWQVKNEVWQEFKSLALDQLKQEIQEEFKRTKELEVKKIVSTIFTENKLKKSNDNHTMVTLTEYLETEIKNSWFKPGESAKHLLESMLREFNTKFVNDLKDSAKQVTSELKEQYDLMFASQIVAKLGENNMLNPDVAKVLLEKK